VKEHIRQDVCQNLSVEYKVEYNDYCLFHAPTVDKDKVEFDALFNKRIKDNHSHFEAVVFPVPLDFNHANFTLPLNFKDATFLSSVAFYKSRLKYAYFDQVRFNGFVQFHLCFFGELATFTGATFYSGAWFTGSHFKRSRFDRVTFAGETRFNSWVKFLDEADFGSAKFLGATAFDTATFESSVSFDEAEFDEDSQVSFYGSSFQASVTFNKAIFKGHLNFEGVESRDVFGDISGLSLRKARLEAPEKLSFHSVRLRPHWFIEADSRRFVLTNIRWETAKVREIKAKDELSSLEDANTATHCPTFARYRLLSIACRQLAENAGTNNRFEEASMLRRMAMDTEWLEKKASFRNWIGNAFKRAEKLKSRFRAGDFFIHGLYRFTSRYGESWAWASGVLLLMILMIFPLFYTRTNFQTCPREKPLAMTIAICASNDEQVKKSCECRQGGLGFGEAVVHSLTTATLQSVDYRKPTTKKGETAVILEKIFAPLQAALLALALRRKFMR
jgi:uncharacterized protein YjbI with pentapeptide repeats